MPKSIFEIRKQLRAISKKNKNANLSTGCCRIYFGGSQTNYSGITRQECNDVCNDFPGATFDFIPGVSCYNATKNSKHS